MFPISRWIAAAMIVAAPVLASDRFEKTLSGTVTYEGGRVLIEHRFGHVSVHTSSANEVVARATVRASDAELGRQIRFNVSNGSDGVVVRTQFPSIHTHDGDISYDADLDVTIPERAPLVLRSQFGDIEVSGLRAPAEIVNRQGSIFVHDIQGGQIENSFGAITLQRSDGDTTVRNANGAINVGDVQGQLAVTNRFATISVQRVAKGASIANTNGNVSVSDVQGPTSISTTFASVVVQGVGGPLSVADQNGNVIAKNVGGDTSIDTRYGLVKVEHVRGNLNVDNANGSVTAADVNGSARVHTTFASVFLSGIDGGVDVENQNGAISVSSLRGGCNNVSLRTTYSPIRISLPSNASYSINARTTYGSIETELPLTVTSKSVSDNSSAFSGTIGGGQCRMELVTTNGGITISRE